MMHCECCDAVLTDIEARIKFKHSGVFANTCLACLATMDTPYLLPKDENEEVLDEEFEFEEFEEGEYEDEDYWDER